MRPVGDYPAVEPPSGIDVTLEPGRSTSLRLVTGYHYEIPQSPSARAILLPAANGTLLVVRPSRTRYRGIQSLSIRRLFSAGSYPIPRPLDKATWGGA